MNCSDSEVRGELQRGFHADGFSMTAEGTCVCENKDSASCTMRHPKLCTDKITCSHWLSMWNNCESNNNHEQYGRDCRSY